MLKRHACHGGERRQMLAESGSAIEAYSPNIRKTLLRKTEKFLRKSDVAQARGGKEEGSSLHRERGAFLLKGA